MRTPHLILAACLTLALGGCQRGPSVVGRYTPGGSWLVFQPNGSVLIGETRDVARFTVDGDSIRISDPMGSVAGRIVTPGVLRFEDQAANAIAVLFHGTWQAAAITGRKTGSDAERERALGSWSAAGACAGTPMEVEPDGKYSWGSNTGSFEMLSADRVRMRMLERGAMVGMLDCGLVLAEGTAQVGSPRRFHDGVRADGSHAPALGVQLANAVIREAAECVA